MKPRILKRANPNRHGLVLLVQTGEDAFEVRDADYDEFGTEPECFDTLAAAETAWEAEIDRLAQIPNWEAQAEYDAAHGTINGYAPWQFGAEY